MEGSNIRMYQQETLPADFNFVLGSIFKKIIFVFFEILLSVIYQPQQRFWVEG